MRSRILVLLTVASGIAACTAITDTAGLVDRAEPLTCGNSTEQSRNDMTVELTKMGPHVDNMVVGDLVKVDAAAATRTQVAQVMWLPLGEPEVSLRLPCTFTAGNHDLDLWADITQDLAFTRCFDPPPGQTAAVCSEVVGEHPAGDHQWRLRFQAGGSLSYEHDTDFTRLDVNVPARRGTKNLVLRFTNLDSFVGKRMVVRARLIDEDRDARDEVIFELNVPRVEAASTQRGQFLTAPGGVVVPSLIKAGERFDVAVWIDTNDNDRYDTPDATREDRDYAASVEILEEGDGAVFPFDGMMPPPIRDVRFEF